MSFPGQLLLKIRRGETPFARTVRGAILRVLHANAPVPSFALPLLRLVYEGYYVGVALWRTAWSYFLWQPLFRSRCRCAGKRLKVCALPYVGGHVEIDIGDDVEFGGKVDILSGRFLDRPSLIIKDRTIIGAGSLISVNREVVIEEDVRISSGCRIYDNDGHPREADLRAQGAPLSPRDIRPVRICRSAWIGRDCHIMKGVTIGEGAIVGANSVVIAHVPPYSLVMGNPAEVYLSNVGKPAAHRTRTPPQE